MTKKTFSFSVKIISFLSIAFFAIYLFQVEKLTKESYFFGVFQKEAKELYEEKFELEEKSNSLVSLEGIEEEVSKLGFVEISKIKYIPVSYDYLAQNSEISAIR